MYEREVVQYIIKFKEQFEIIKHSPGDKNEEFIAYGNFLSHISHIYQKDLEFLSDYFFELLSLYETILHYETRFRIVKNLIMMRNKGLLKCEILVLKFFQLLKLKDKNLRSLVRSYIINDLKKENKGHKNIKLNKKIQNTIYEIIKQNDDDIA